MVSAVEFQPEYGNIVDVDHDNGLTSRYAHLSKSMVKVGDVVMKGQQIALVGATGRTTGPHLHFEVREKGIPLNPNKFLSLGNKDVLDRQRLPQVAVQRVAFGPARPHFPL